MNNNSLLKAEPVLAAHLASAVVGYVLTLMVTHGVITDTQSSAVAQQAISIAAAVLLALLGVLVRRFVTPAAKFAERVESEVAARLSAAYTTPAIVAPVVVPVPAVAADPALGAPVYAPEPPAEPVADPAVPAPA